MSPEKKTALLIKRLEARVLGLMAETFHVGGEVETLTFRRTALEKIRHDLVEISAIHSVSEGDEVLEAVQEYGHAIEKIALCEVGQTSPEVQVASPENVISLFKAAQSVPERSYPPLREKGALSEILRNDGNKWPIKILIACFFVTRLKGQNEFISRDVTKMLRQTDPAAKLPNLRVTLSRMCGQKDKPIELVREPLRKTNRTPDQYAYRLTDHGFRHAEFLLSQTQREIA